MKNRVAGNAPRESSSPSQLSDRFLASNQPQTVLGLDPSLRGTGYGLIHTGPQSITALAHGTITCPRDWERSRCLAHISHTLRDLLQRHRPALCVVEGLFFAQNIKTAIIMGEARGAAMAVIAEAGLDIFEIATRKVKQAIVGYGAAQKIAVARMVQRMLSLAELPAPDAADALALALTYVRESSRHNLVARKKI